MDDYDFYQINLYVFIKLHIYFINYSGFKGYYYYYSPFLSCDMNVSAADLGNYWTEIHETWWSYIYMFLGGPKVFSFVVKGVKVIF